MDLHTQYHSIINPMPFMIKEYKTPLIYQDPLKQIIDRRNFNYKNKRPETTNYLQQKKRKKKFFIEEMIQPIKNNPSSANYKTELNLLNAKKAKSNKDLNKVDPKFSKHTYIQQIQNTLKKNKAPGIGKYNLLTITSFSTEKKKKMKTKNNPQRVTQFQNIVSNSLSVPGAGQFNPHLQVKKVHMDRTDYKFYKKKHQQQEQKLKRSQSAKLGPSSYNPIGYNTFDSIRECTKKQKPISKWTHGKIQIRKGLKSSQKKPGPAEYVLINQWSPSKGSKQQPIGKMKILQKTVKTARPTSVYY